MLYLRTKDPLKRYRVSLSIKKCGNLIEKRVEFREFLRDFSGLLKWRIFLSEELPELSHARFTLQGTSLRSVQQVCEECNLFLLVGKR
ncbi:hypothetical protein B6U74_07585 [Candidatus Bathyarchaeota archaeon ex4484_205]|nr:MAG: hypothetical protein B6U74_07585 [Candidatus Bathyarchaeota archaeon ex4484_205]